MAFTNRNEWVTLVASADLSARQFRIVELTTDGKANLAQLNKGYGVLQNIPLAGEHASVCVKGETKMHAGDTIAIADYLRVQSGGWAIAVASGAAHPAAFVSIGRAITAAASGALFTAEINRNLVTGLSSGAAWAI
jgi:hypothetical protein